MVVIIIICAKSIFIGRIILNPSFKRVFFEKNPALEHEGAKLRRLEGTN
ncbi:hypothetical protein NC99_00110 [Sunxiuqinia dokdonensis]|uniref:Uncharacterized protein n=1 Tax=Sunxiuqinia dokdonensis TaxID=1409788 RepID=A0A0L8VFQ8_9BACT|nr:hypothetical protein NC99_00110 [Sunxiuqinia dokdonensis]